MILRHRGHPEDSRETLADSADLIEISVDGITSSVLPGISLTAALVQQDLWTLRRNLSSGEPRGPFCGMGICFECEVTVDGNPGVRACLARTQAGMAIQTSGGIGNG